MQGYLAGVADSDSSWHRLLTYIVLASVVAIHGAGTWYGNVKPA